MVTPNEPGKIILINGATSSGKSSIARALQGMIEAPFWHFSIDHLRDAGCRWSGSAPGSSGGRS